MCYDIRPQVQQKVPVFDHQCMLGRRQQNVTIFDRRWEKVTMPDHRCILRRQQMMLLKKYIRPPQQKGSFLAHRCTLTRRLQKATIFHRWCKEYLIRYLTSGAYLGNDNKLLRYCITGAYLGYV